MKDALDIKIYYEDTDCGGVVYYGNYLTYLERARTEFLEARGVHLARLMAEGFYFAVVHVDISYHKPARYGDVITVFSELTACTATTLTFSHRIEHRAKGIVLATSKVKLAGVNSLMKPVRISSEITEAVKT